MKINVITVIALLIVSFFQTLGSTDRTSGLIRNDIPLPTVYSFSMTKTTDVGYFSTDPSLGFRKVEKITLIVPPNDPEAVTKVSASSLSADISSGIPIYTGEIAPKSILYTYSLDYANSLENDVTVFKGSFNLGMVTGNFTKEVKRVNNNGTWYEEVNKITSFSSSFTSVPSVVGVGEYQENSDKVAINCLNVKLKLDLTKSSPINPGATLRIYISGERMSDRNRIVIGTTETSAWGTKPVVTVNFPTTDVFHSVVCVLEERYTAPAVQ